MDRALVVTIGDDAAMVELKRPPEQIAVDSVGVVLRRHRIYDVDRLHAVIEESRDHVRPFMPWADQTRDETAAFVARAVDEWDSGTSFNYALSSNDRTDERGERILGGCGLHARCGPGAIEIGYWLHPAATGRGVVTASAAALTAAAFTELGIERVEIHCDEANLRSAAVPRRLGFELDRIEDRPVTAAGEHGRHMVWVRRADRQRPAP